MSPDTAQAGPGPAIPLSPPGRPRARRLAALLLALLLATPAFATPALARSPSPALWVAHAGQLTVYLFGSMHALPKGTAWETAPINRAFDSADQAWFEAIIANIGPSLFGAVAEGIDLAHTLSDRLAPAEAARLHQAAATLPAPVTSMLDHMRPWLAALVISTARAAEGGFEDEQGVDRTLQARANAAGKPLTAIEDPARTLHAVATLPEAAGLAMLREALSPKSETPMLRRLAADWLAGDVPGVARLMQAGLPAGSALGHALLAERNAAWADRLAGLQDQHTTIFLTVGVGHLAGPGNLRELLARKGFALTRVPTGTAR